MKKIIEEISKIGIVPVIALDREEDAEPLAEALCKGGLPCAEVTFRTKAAKEAIRRMTCAFPDMLVGAGTVLTPEQVDDAMEAGAKFIVSPGFNPNTVKYCQKKGISIIPGCANPSDIEAALELGLTEVKFFPAEALGGLPMIKAMSAPYSNVKFMPTGGINASNINSYLDFDKILACGGTYMVAKDLIAAGNFEKITELTAEAVRNMLGFELCHVGINAENEEDAGAIADAFSGIFGFRTMIGQSSFFLGTAIEVMKSGGQGKHGHIAIGTRDIRRAIFHLEKNGVEFDFETCKNDANGKLKAIYLKETFGGFAVHLVQK